MNGKLWVIILFVQIILYGFYNGYYYNRNLEMMVYFFPLYFFLFNIKNILKIKKIVIFKILFIMLILFYPLITNLTFYLSKPNLIEYIKYIYNVLFICVFPSLIANVISDKNKKRIINFYFIFLKINIAAIFIQILLMILGKNFNFFWQYASRPSGLLAEPSFQFYLCIPLLFLSNELKLFPKKWKVLMCIALLGTLSLNNFIFILLLIGLDREKDKMFFNFLYFIFLGIIIFCIFSDFRLSNFKNYNFIRLENSFKLTDASSLYRIKRPIRIFIANEKKLFGVGIKNEKEIEKLIKKTNYDQNELYTKSPMYMNGFFKELNFFGIVGGILLNILYVLILIKKKIYFGIGFMILRIGNGISYNSGIIILYILLLSLDKKKGETKNENRIDIWNKTRSNKNSTCIS